MSESDISIIIATRNRLNALQMSLPLILAQSYKPREVFVVDSSDDPEPIRAFVESQAAQTDIPVEHIESAPGLTKQRNVGLARVNAPLVMFPDDDSLLFETCLEEVVGVYNADKDEVLVGVTVRPAGHSPLKGQSGEPQVTYDRKSPGTIRYFLGSIYNSVERQIAPIPYIFLRREIIEGKTLPDAVAQLDCSVAPDQEGFRMSFRTKYLRQAPFNECLSGYSLGEDIDVCYGLAEKGMIARLNRHLIYHNEFPGPRVNGYRWGVMQPVNIAYIVSRHTEPGHKARRAVFPWLRVLILQLLLRLDNQYQRDRLKGILKARRQLCRLIEAPRQNVDAVYLSIMEEI